MAEPVRIIVRPSGPYFVEGPVVVVDLEGREYTSEKPRIALCRCGGSASKPFCDGSHRRNGFTTEADLPGGDGPTRTA
jgi:CDGSH-type Zn-finger protein